MGTKTKSKKASHVAVHKFSAGVCLLAFLVISISGLSAGSSVYSIAYRMMLVTLAVTCISRVVITICQHSEEMSSGEG